MASAPPSPRFSSLLTPIPPFVLNNLFAIFSRHSFANAVVWAMALAVFLYSIGVLVRVAWMGDIGVRCVFGTEIKEDIPDDFTWRPERPRTGDVLREVDGMR